MSDKLTKPWTIKGISDEDRNAAIAAAKRERMSIGAWVARAFRAQIKADINQERSVAIVSEQTLPPSAAPPAAVYYPPSSLDALVDTALKASHPDLDPNVRNLINSTLLDQVRDLRRARRVARGAPDGRQANAAADNTHTGVDRGSSEGEIQEGAPRHP